MRVCMWGAPTPSDLLDDHSTHTLTHTKKQILLTNDGRVPNAVLRSSLNHRKTYKVRLCVVFGSWLFITPNRNAAPRPSHPTQY